VPERRDLLRDPILVVSLEHTAQLLSDLGMLG
jgi:hypothetical protein